jgi:hypothetical protein
MNLNGSVYEPTAGFCEYGDEIFDSIKGIP